MTDSVQQVQSAKSRAFTKHGHASRELNQAKESPTYASWRAMRTRCNSVNRDNAYRYSQLGVKVCERWNSFANFLEDMGERPSGHTLDRWPNAAGDYEPGNCRWATPREQSRNRAKNVLTFETAKEVARLRLLGGSCKKIGEQFGISQSLARHVSKGTCWPDALEAAKELLRLERGGS